MIKYAFFVECNKSEQKVDAGCIGDNSYVIRIVTDEYFTINVKISKLY